jgi:hypothetical protein
MDTEFVEISTNFVDSATNFVDREAEPIQKSLSNYANRNRPMQN